MADSCKKPDLRKREIAKQLPLIEDIRDLDQDFVEEHNDKRLKELVQFEKRRNDLLPEHQKMHNMSHKLQSLQEKKIAVSEECHHIG